MRKLHISRCLSLLLVVCLLLSTVSVLCGLSTEHAYAADSSSYYSSITAAGGTALLGQLHDLITTTHKKYTSYDDCKTPSTIIKTDKGSSDSYVMEFYSQKDISKKWGGGNKGTWNREHVWCQSLSNGLWGTSGGGSDLHHIRPVEFSLNSARGNDKFGEVTNGAEKYYKDSNSNKVALGGYGSGGVFEPLDKVKGDVARIVMYMYTHYNTYSNVGGTTNGSGSASFGTLKFINVMSAANEEAAISLLLKWNKEDPVDDIERARNEAVYAIQGNRNPFIDNSNYANLIWGKYAEIPDLEDIKVTPDDIELTVGQSKQLTVTGTPTGADARVTWSSDDESIARVSSTGIVTGVAEGETLITATSVENPEIDEVVYVSVTKKAVSGGQAHYLTITADSFDMTDGYGFKEWTVDGVSGFAFIYGGSSSYPATGMQFNKSKDSYYLASNVALPGYITSVTVKMVNGYDAKPWKLLTSNEAYTQVTGKPTNGNDWNAKDVTSEGTTWEVSGTDTFFALTYELTSSKGASYLDSITIEYVVEGEGGDVTPDNPDNPPTPVVGTIEDFVASVSALDDTLALSQRFEDIQGAIAIYNSLSAEDKEDDTVKSSLATLQSAITKYNEVVSDINTSSKTATSNAVGATCSFILLASALVELIKKFL